MNPFMEFRLFELERSNVQPGTLIGQLIARAGRYYDFLAIIGDRHKAASADFVEKQKRFMELTAGSGKMSAEQTALWQEIGRVGTILHLEIVSFYLLAKILIDRLANLIEYCFGQGTGASLASHHKLVNSLEAYVGQKGLSLPEGFSEMATRLYEGVCCYRDKQIVHDKSPRSASGWLWRADGQVRLMSRRLYPTERDEQVNSEYVDDLFAVLDEYAHAVLDLVRRNQDKVTFRSKKGDG